MLAFYGRKLLNYFKAEFSKLIRFICADFINRVNSEKAKEKVDETVAKTKRKQEVIIDSTNKLNEKLLGENITEEINSDTMTKAQVLAIVGDLKMTRKQLREKFE